MFRNPTLVTRGLSLLAISATWAVACTAPEPPGGNGQTSSSGQTSNGSTESTTVGTTDIDLTTGDTDFDIGQQPAPASCGDGIVDDVEACDDGTIGGGDGCGANCLFVEEGFICPSSEVDGKTIGEPCRPYSKCGDGVVVFPEQCDPGATPVVGCTATCKLELGYKCEGSPSACSPTVCGDGNIEGTETCEDGNTLPFDGCDQNCNKEPDCSSMSGMGCSTTCGDGLIIGTEQCDDGNGVSGDGCSETCTEEPGYTCTVPPVDTTLPLDLPIVYRDFNTSHPDFQEPETGDAANWMCNGFAPGIVAPTLDMAGKPVYASTPPKSCVSAAGFPQWYTDSEVSGTILGNILLFPNGNGGYVNRFGTAGDGLTATQYAGMQNGTGSWCGNVGQHADCAAAFADNQCNVNYDPAVHTCWEVGATAGQDVDGGAVPNNCCTNCFCAGTTDQAMYDGNPLFFPIDNHPDAITPAASYYAARIPAQVYEGLGWPWEGGGTEGTPPAGSPMHNFHFTSEVAYWFEYDETTVADLSFLGDDDVWVFLNRRLVLDIGGIHVPLGGRLSIAAGGAITTRVWEPLDPGDEAPVPMDDITSTLTAADLGMSPGNVYEIKVFQAERKPEGSSFQLTLAGFNAARSTCEATCGDGIIAGGEQCDDGEAYNVGGHTRCNPDCTLGSFCGDGIVQPEAGEECDDNAPDAGSDCSNCREGIIR